MSNDVSEHLFVEIFSRLPSKSLLRFRSLSKSLHACIGSPSFIRLHTLRSPKNLTIIHRIRSKQELIYTIHSESKLSYNAYIRVPAHEYPFKSCSIIGSCNGILLVYECGKGINLWNPSIRRKVTVPDLPSFSDCLVHGFGFDPIFDDYKILRTSQTSSFVYTLKTRAWREIASPTTPFSQVINPCQCLFNGALHWVVKSYSTSYYYILKFDLCSEVFSTIELPEPSTETSVVTVIKGCLAVVSSTRDGRSWIRVMSEYNNPASWYVAFNLYKSPFEGAKKVFERATNGDLVFSHNNAVQAYNPKEHVLSTLRILSRSSVSVDANICVESLGLLDMGTSCDNAWLLRTLNF